MLRPLLMLRPLITAILFAFSLTGLAQRTGQAKIDSIVSLPAFQKSDTGKVKMLVDVAQTLLYINPAKAYTPAREAYDLAVSLKWRKGQANSLNALGLVVGDSGNNTAARKYFEEALEINRTEGNRFRMITNLNNLARAYLRESNFNKALDAYLQALRLAEEMKDDEQISLVGTGLMAFYINQQDYKKGEQYGKMTIEHGERAHSMANVGTANLNLGLAALLQGDSATARAYLVRALKIYRDLNNKTMIANALESIAEVDMTDAKKALPELLEVRKLLDLTAPRSGQSSVNYGNIGLCYDALGRDALPGMRKKALCDSAVYYLSRALHLAEEAKNVSSMLDMNESLAIAEETAGKPAAALQYYKTFMKLNDSLYSQEKKNQIAGIQGKHDVEMKDKEIAISKLEVNNQRLLVNAQKKTQFGLLIGVIFLAVIGLLLFRQSAQRKKTNTTLLTLNNQLDEANKVKARFFGILSHDLRSPISSLLSFLNVVKEEPGMLTGAEQAAHQQQIGRSAEELLETMEAMLLWSKEQMDDFKPDIRLVSVADLFLYIEKFFGTDQRVQLRFSDPQHLSIPADENYLRVIMQNLTSNALKVLRNSPEGLVEWSARVEGDKTILAIRDNGPGINPDQAKTLFSDNPALNARTGFGLHLVRDLAKAIRYSISVDATPGMGTTFQLTV